MATYTYSGSTLIDVAPTSENFVISPPDSGTITSVVCSITITPPNEGGGANPALLTIKLIQTLSGGVTNTVILHNNTSTTLTSVIYPTNTSPDSGSMNLFNGTQLSGSNWTLQVVNFSAFGQGTLVSYALTITTQAATAVAPYVPVAPVSVSLPTTYKYGLGGNIKRNDRITFNRTGSINAAIKNMDTQRVARLNCNIEDIQISATNPGTVGTSSFSLHRVRSGVDTTLTNGNLILPFNSLSNVTISFKDTLIDKGLIAGDVLYLSIDSVATGLQNLEVQLILNERR